MDKSRPQILDRSEESSDSELDIAKEYMEEKLPAWCTIRKTSTCEEEL